MATSSLHNLALAARTIHIKIQPTARTLTERREVVRVLERFGEVQMFRSLKYDPTHPVQNAFISLMASASQAESLINASPIRYQLLPNPAPPSSSPAASSPPPPPSSSSTLPSISSSPSTATSTFEIRISPSSYPHQAAIASSPLYGPYKPIPRRRSLIADDLAERIPRGVAFQGLCDWETDTKGARFGVGVGAAEGVVDTMPWRLRGKRSGGGGVGGEKGRS